MTEHSSKPKHPVQFDYTRHADGTERIRLKTQSMSDVLTLRGLLPELRKQQSLSTDTIAAWLEEEQQRRQIAAAPQRRQIEPAREVVEEDSYDDEPDLPPSEQPTRLQPEKTIPLDRSSKDDGYSIRIPLMWRIYKLLGNTFFFGALSAFLLLTFMLLLLKSPMFQKAPSSSPSPVQVIPPKKSPPPKPSPPKQTGGGFNQPPPDAPP